MKFKTLFVTLTVLILAGTVANAQLTTKQQIPSTTASGISETTTTAATVQNLQSELDKLQAIVNRNQDNAASDPNSILDTWYKAFTLSSEFKPVFAWNNRQKSIASDRQTILSNNPNTTATIPTLDLYLDASINSFTTAHTALSYNYNPDKYASYQAVGVTVPAPAAPSSTTALFFSEANIQFSDFAQSGFYTTLGKQFFNFGAMERDPVNAPFTFLLTKLNGVGATGGYISPVGFNISSYILNGALGLRTNATNGAVGSSSKNVDIPLSEGNTRPDQLRTWGLSAGYNTNQVAIQADYLNNIAQTIYFSHAINDFHIRANFLNQSQTFVQRTPGMAAHVKFTPGNLSLIFDYVAALRKFSSTDLYANDPNSGAKPSATFTQLGYNFPLEGHNTLAYVGYQTTTQAQQVFGSELGGFYFPKTRQSIGYKYYIQKYTSLNLELDHDNDYAVTNGGSGRTSNGVALALDVKF